MDTRQQFVDAYLEALVFSVAKNKRVSKRLLLASHKDCLSFISKAEEYFTRQDSGIQFKSDTVWTQAGYNFWFTRSYDGCGFWEKEWGEVKDKLTEIAHTYPIVDIEVNGNEIDYC